MQKITINNLKKQKTRGEKITALTAYDASFSHLIDKADIDIILVGDSLGMVIQGHKNTLRVTMDDICYHTKCVASVVNKSLLMSDMPFMANASQQKTLENAARLIRCGADIIKIEGGKWLADDINILSQHGIAVCAHIGLTPQAICKLGGFKIQGCSAKSAAQLIETAKILEHAGADMLVVECIPASLGKAITEAVQIPVIGIGAGRHTDGQVLVLHDILGITLGRPPCFAKNFMASCSSIQGAIDSYRDAVKSKAFPDTEHEFTPK